MGVQANPLLVQADTVLCLVKPFVSAINHWLWLLRVCIFYGNSKLWIIILLYKKRCIRFVDILDF